MTSTAHPATAAPTVGAVPPHGQLPILSSEQRVGLDPALLDVVEYRKSGLSLNWIVGCPLDYGYCVRHLFGNFTMKTPRALLPDRKAFELLTGHRFFQPDLTPIQLLNRATDPMLPPVKPHTFAMLAMLDDAGYRNHVLVITRPTPACPVLPPHPLIPIRRRAVCGDHHRTTAGRRRRRHPLHLQVDLPDPHR